VEPIVIISIVLIFGMLFTGFPIYIALTLGSVLILIFHGGFPLPAIADYFYTNLEGFTLLAVPLFILAGNLMLRGNSAQPLINVIKSFIGHLPGGLALATILAAGVFSALTGSTGACTAAIGLIMVPAMIKDGYNQNFSGGLMACCGTLGNLIPPSIWMILYAMLAKCSVADLFMAGVFPGILVIFIFGALAAFIAWRQGFKKRPAASWRERFTVIYKAVPAVFTVVIILGGIYGGIFTPTEAGAIGCVYAVLIGFFVYRGLTLKTLWETIVQSARLTAMIFLILVGAIVMCKALILVGLPQAISSVVLHLNLSPMLFLLASTVVILVLGCVIDSLGILFVCVPILLPTALEMGIEPIHFAIVIIIGMMIAAVTPPIGVSIYYSSGLFKIPAEGVIKGSLPFLAAMVVCLLLVIVFPTLSTWLPSTM
jgi:C4-dicarboxylate transporter DctM subunit